MIPIIRQELSRCLKLKCSDIRILENVSRHKLNKTLYGKSFRITPIRFSQSKTNNDKTDSFTYKPGMSPADFKNSGPGPKKPWYKQMSGAKGQMVSGILVSVVATGVAIFKIGQHTRLKEYVQTYYQLGDARGFSKKVNVKLQQLVYEVIEDDIQLSPDELLNTKFFMGSQPDTYCWGSYSSYDGSGVLIGLPHYLAYEHANDIDLRKFRFARATTDTEKIKQGYLNKRQLESKEAKIFQNAMVLSDNAKRFAIAREVYRGQTNKYLTNGLILPTFIGIGYLLSRALNKKLFLFKKAPIFRGIMYCIMATVSTYTAVLFEDINKYYTDIALDEKTCKLGVEYTKGGIELYDNTIKWNLAFRLLAHENWGKDMFNLEGNSWPSLFRPHKHIPLTLRRQTCVDAYTTLKNKGTEDFSEK